MRFTNTQGKLLIKRGSEKLIIEALGKNGLRVRATVSASFGSQKIGALPEGVEEASINISANCATITNGRIEARISKLGQINFYSDGQPILKELYRSFQYDQPHTPVLRITAREYKPIAGENFKITQRFESAEDEKFFGMGQYQQPHLDLKGCSLELAQRNSQISIPFLISNKGYGFLWNNPAVGNVIFGKNGTIWCADSSKQLDYWICADETPKNIMANYTHLTGRASLMPKDILGLWQSKLRYRTQEEVLSVAREYKKRGIPLDVIVIDFFHWTQQGEWMFDPLYWPNPEEMVRELKALGIRCMISVWPTVDKRSINYEEMKERGLLVRVEKGSPQTIDFLGDTVAYDATNPEAREFVWAKCKQNYFDKGIDLFWLDVAEPEFSDYDFEHFRYHAGQVNEVGSLYPLGYAQTFYDGLKAEGQEVVVLLARSTWVGGAQRGVIVWSGDIYGNFVSLKDQFAAGLNIGIAGVPWWTTDVGGFFVDVDKPDYKELLLRWFEYSVFSPILRLHGNKGPSDIAPLDDRTFGGGFAATGLPNELWSFGEKAYEIMKKYVEVRTRLKPYLMELNEEAHSKGFPLMRTMFFEYPDDEVCWELDEQYMLGSKLLVAPVLNAGQTKKRVYLPKGKWREYEGDMIYDGGRYITVTAPIDTIPVFQRID